MFNNIFQIKIQQLLSSKILKASSWVFIGYIVSQIIRLFSNLVLTRILVPEMFGLMAVVNVIVIGISMLSDIGIAQSIIQNKRGEETDFINTAWTMQIIRGVVIFIIILIIAVVLLLTDVGYSNDDSTVYSDPVFPSLLIVLSFGSIITGFNSTSIHLINRNLDMKRWTLISLFVQFITISSMIVFAIFTKSIWALVLGSLIGNIIEMVLSHTHLKGIKNKICWDYSSQKEIIKFGKWIFLSTAIGFLANQGDRLILGDIFSPTLLGVYSVALMLSTLPSMMVSTFSHKILFPKFSALNRNNPSELKFILIKARYWLSFIVLPVLGFTIAFSQVIVDLLYDERYRDAGWMLELLFIRVVIACIFTPSSIALMAIGQPRYATIAAATNAVFMIVFLPIIFQTYGVYGAVLSIALGGFVNMPIIWYGLFKNKLFDMKSEILALSLICIFYSIGQYVYSTFINSSIISY